MAKTDPDGRPLFVSRAEGGWFLRVKAQPGAKKSEVAGLAENALRIRIAAPAVENKANKALCVFVAGLLGLRPARVRLVSGESARAKRLFVESDAEPDWNALLPDAGQG